MPKADAASADLAGIRVASSAAELGTVHAIRREVFIEEQGVPAEEEWDELDATSVHLLALDRDGTPLGTGRLIHGPQALAITGRPGAVLLGRLAVLKRARGTGLGVALVRAVEAEGRARGATELELHAQVHALGFYTRLGYVAEGPEYLDGGIPHRTMTRSLAG
ncbi:GNAT family N-acetyltransferase [Streptacidiphilus cavernicola]|uniref:GNAT family N-acetyltransferase n=1 Tax=Streptacidiphilus cavernicola TaxID=3342716 RepID=A0ABV6VT05_9ACTN